jgi:hypothetical protein
LSEGLSSSTRRRVLAGVLLVAAAVTLVAVAQRSDRPVARSGGDLTACARLKDDSARACYTREVGRELAAVGTGGVTLSAPAESTQVTFTSSRSEPQPLLCDLHERVGVVDEQTPSWLGWSEPIVTAAPQS